MTGKYCPACGAEVPGEVALCVRCGSNTSSVIEAPESGTLEETSEDWPSDESVLDVLRESKWWNRRPMLRKVGDAAEAVRAWWNRRRALQAVIAIAALAFSVLSLFASDESDK